jgi:hypothetical protein
VYKYNNDLIFLFILEMICSRSLFLALTIVSLQSFIFIKAALVEDNEDARLLVAKNILNNYVVEGLDLSIKYNIFNVGNLLVFLIDIISLALIFVNKINK